MPISSSTTPLTTVHREMRLNMKESCARGDICKPNQSSLIAHLDEELTDDGMQVTGGYLAAVLDSMSKVGSFETLLSFETFEK